MKYLRRFNNLTDAKIQGSKALDAPQTNYVEGYKAVNIASPNTDRFTCQFDNNGKMINVSALDPTFKIKKFASQPFLGEISIEDYDFTTANRFLIERYGDLEDDFDGRFAFCSSCRNGNFAGRNLDWYIKDYALLAVHMPANATKNRYASIGICSSNPIINREIIANGYLPDMASVNGIVVENIHNNFPVFTTDGINEKGVCVNTNIVLHEDGAREGYVPCSGHGGELISFVALPRYILDNCESCDDAIGKLSALSVTQATKGPLSTEDSHFMVSDANKTIVFEWYNNEMVYTVYEGASGFTSPHGMPAIMTNFYNYICEKHTSGGTTNWDNMLIEHPYAMGIERFENLADGLSGVTSVELMKSLIEKDLYSKYYDVESYWYSEGPRDSYFKENGQWKYWMNVDKTLSGSATDARDAMVKAYNTLQMEEDRNFGSLDKQMKILDKGGESEYWYTELTSIFDINNKKLYIQPQEGWYKKQYIKFEI